jgi:ATP-dependent Clp protease ATP-binding subunit ClpB
MDLANLKEDRNEIYAKWKSEKDVVDNIQNIKTEIEDFKYEAERAEREGDYGKVAEIRYGKIKEAQERLDVFVKQLQENQLGTSLIKEEVTREDIAEVVAKWTGIPIVKMLQGEREKLLKLEAELHRRVVGQEEAIEAVSDAVRRSRAGLQDIKKPIGTFLFLGTTGVGKTELAKALAEYLFDDENSMTRIDMSEYQERHSVSRLVGAPPGYIGYDEGGQLTEAVRRKPYSVILLDEIEKAHPDTFNILLQVLDEGRLTDNKGRLADFKNTIIIMTSNMGSEIIQEKFENLKGGIEAATEVAKMEVLNLLKQTVRPEFINRIDEIVMFTPLTNENIKEIVGLQLKSVMKMLAKQQITLDATPEAINYLAVKGYDPQFGARPVKRVIQKEVLNELSKEILSGKIAIDSIILLDSFNGQLVFRNQSELIES